MPYAACFHRLRRWIMANAYYAEEPYSQNIYSPRCARWFAKHFIGPCEHILRQSLRVAAPAAMFTFIALTPIRRHYLPAQLLNIIMPRYAFFERHHAMSRQFFHVILLFILLSPFWPSCRQRHILQPLATPLPQPGSEEREEIRRRHFASWLRRRRFIQLCLLYGGAIALRGASQAVIWYLAGYSQLWLSGWSLALELTGACCFIVYGASHAIDSRQYGR